jgi:hypothetical protein
MWQGETLLPFIKQRMSIQDSRKTKVVIVVEASEKEFTDSPTATAMLLALKQAIATSTNPPTTVKVLRADLELNASWTANQAEGEKLLLCPLTLNLAPTLKFDAQAVYQACRDVPELRQLVAQQLGYSVGDGCFWLPVVNTAKGPLYGEVIGVAGQAANAKLPEHLSLSALNYYQPFHLSDLMRQQLYQLGFGLLQLLSLPPTTYLVQFGFLNQEIYFDRLWPFPAAPAIASLGVQQPDLFACHWNCLCSVPIFDLLIIPTMTNSTQ